MVKPKFLSKLKRLASKKEEGYSEEQKQMLEKKYGIKTNN